MARRVLLDQLGNRVNQDQQAPKEGMAFQVHRDQKVCKARKDRGEHRVCRDCQERMEHMYVTCINI
jgi:hypothetical protein